MRSRARTAFLRPVATAILVSLFSLTGCDSDDPGANESLVLAFTGLETLAGGFHYEGWAIIEGQPVSTGKFDVNSSGDLVDLDGNLIARGTFDADRDLSAATTIVITIEPPGDTDATPASTKILAGSVAGRQGALDVSHPQALGTNFASASGTFILATPTDGSGNNETSGVWFIDPSSGSPLPGLTLPTLPAGWRFEGWTVFDAATPVTTGAFTSVFMADLAAPFSGPMPGPPFPGEDYLINAPTGLTFPTDLSGKTVVITVEPFPDDSAAPFTIKLLTGNIPSPASPATPYTMTFSASSFPTGTARIE